MEKCTDLGDSHVVLREKCPNTELFLVRIQSEYRKIRSRNNSAFAHFSRSVRVIKPLKPFCFLYILWYISADKLSSKSAKASATAKIGNFVKTFWSVIFAVIYPTKIISSTLSCYNVAIRRPSFFFHVVRASNRAQWCCEPCNWESSHIKSYDCPKGTLKTSIFLDYRKISSQKLKQNKLMYSQEFIGRYSQRIFLFFEWRHKCADW